MSGTAWDGDNTIEVRNDGLNVSITYKSEVLGGGVFWEGKSEDANKIRSIPARSIAKRLINEGGGETTYGMWNIKVAKRGEVT